MTQILWDMEKEMENKRELDNSVKGLVRSGRHLGYIRNYLKCYAVSGEYLTWGSAQEAKLRHTMTVLDWELLATKIATHAQKQLMEELDCCSNFTPEPKDSRTCYNCELSREVHLIKQELEASI